MLNKKKKRGFGYFKLGESYKRMKGKYDAVTDWKKELDLLKEHPTKMEQYNAAFKQAKQVGIDKIDYV